MTYNGWANYATWSIVLWADEPQSRYENRMEWLRDKETPVTSEEAEDWCWKAMGGTTPDIEGTKGEGSRRSDIDWEEVADAFEHERLEERGEFDE